MQKTNHACVFKGDDIYPVSGVVIYVVDTNKNN